MCSKDFGNMLMNQYTDVERNRLCFHFKEKEVKSFDIIDFRKTSANYCAVSGKQDCPPEGPLSGFEVKS